MAEIQIDTPDKTSISFEPITPDTGGEAASTESVSNTPDGVQTINDKTGEEPGKKAATDDTGGDPGKKAATDDTGGDPGKKASTDDTGGDPGKKAATADTGEEPVINQEKVNKKFDKLTFEKHEALRARDNAIKMAAAQGLEPVYDAQGGLTGFKAPDFKPVEFDIAKPKLDDFETHNEYIEALGSWSAEKKFFELNQGNKNTADTAGIEEQERSFGEKLDKLKSKGEAKYKNWAETGGSDKAIITEHMAKAFIDSEIGEDIAHYLGENPTEAERIAKLPPHRQAVEIGMIEGGFKNKPPLKTKTTAPSPINTVGSGSVTDKSLDQMSNAEYRKARGLTSTGAPISQ